jgi:hypothetical protein
VAAMGVLQDRFQSRLLITICRILRDAMLFAYACSDHRLAGWTVGDGHARTMMVPRACLEGCEPRRLTLLINLRD